MTSSAEETTATVYNHQPRRVGPEVQRRINALGIGQKMQDLPEDLWHDSFRYYVKEDPSRKGGPNLRIIRLDPAEPSLTVTGFIFNKFVHPYEDRYITPREAARLQGFPDDLEFKGSLTSVQRQIGDAVPVELGQAVFESLLDTLAGHWPDQGPFNALSLFSGAGGLEVAAQQATCSSGARLRTFASVEIDNDRCDTLRGYFGDEPRVFQRDIREIDAAYVLDACNMTKADVWLLYGGPPCQAFSQAGKQKGARDPRGTLISEFLRFLRQISPPFFMMENVSNLKGIQRGQLLQDILAEMKEIGYKVDARVLTATHYGSPQRRRRCIFVGSREDLLVMTKLPEPTHAEPNSLLGLPPFKTVSDAFAGLPSPDYEPVEVD